MDPLVAFAVLVALIAAATAVGLALRHRTGRVRVAAPDALDLAEFGPVDGPPVAAGARATLLQFSTEFCSPCRATARVLSGLAASTPGVSHIDVDLTERPQLAAKYQILQTPTTFILDAQGVVRARIGGAPRVDDLRRRLTEVASSAAPTYVSEETHDR